MGKVRVNRVGEEIKKELSILIQREMKDPRIGFCTVTGVEMSNDLSVAKVYLSVMGSNDQGNEALKAITKAQGFLRSELGKKIRFRIVPELVFKLDGSIAYGSKIESIIQKIRKEDPQVQTEVATTDGTETEK